jgi:PDZ domain
MPVDLALDTGFGGVVQLHEPFVRAQNLLARYAKHIDIETPGGVDGPLAVSVAMARRLQLGSLSIDQPRFAMTRDAPPENGLRDGIGLMRHVRPRSEMRHTDGLLGLAALFRWKPFIDSAGQRLVLEPRVVPLPPPTPGWRGVGLSLDKPERGFFSVLSVIPETPAAQAGISPGDRIVSINAAPARDFALFDYGRLGAVGPVTLRLASGFSRTLSAVSLLP